MFGFKPVTRCIYRNNFLNLVVFRLQFSPKKEIFSDLNVFKGAFGNICTNINQSNQSGIKIELNNQTPIVTNEVGNTVIEMKSDDGTKTIEVTENTLTFSIMAPAYESFDKLKADMVNLGPMLIKLDIDEISQIAIRKINIINFNTKGPGESSIDIIKRLLSPTVLSNLSLLSSANSIQRDMKSMVYNKDNNGLHIQYGLIVPDENTRNAGHVIIDIDRIDNNMMKIQELWNKATIMNNEIFNTFDSIISDELKTHMNAPVS